MPDLEYTVQVSSEIDFELPDGERMAQILHQGLMDWYYDAGGRPVNRTPYLKVDVVRVSDDL